MRVRMWLQVPLRMPTMSSKRLATRPSRMALMMGIPPATLASKRNWPPCWRTAAKISGPCSQRRALLAETTTLPARSARRVSSRALVVPPMSSQTTWTLGSSMISFGFLVSLPAGIFTARFFLRSRTQALRRSSFTPRRDSRSACFSERCFQTPWPTVPKPRMPIPMVRGADMKIRKFSW